VVARLLEAGLSCLGKLNMHPMALGATNHNRDFGPCGNPRAAGRTPGGSSGGSAAAVAAGLCGLSLGTDTMGSVRLPAAYCGVVGFKPGHETLGLDGVVPLSRQLDHVGVLARRVEDIIAAMAAMAPGRARRLLDSPRAASGAVGRSLRLAALGDARSAGATPEVAGAYDRALDLLRAAGWGLEFIDLGGIDLGAARRAGLLLCEAELHTLLRPLLQTVPESLPGDLLAMMRYIEGRSAVDLGRAVAQVALTGEALDRLTDGLDALLLPTAPQTAFLMDGSVPSNQADFTALANMNGAPAISVPVPVADDSLPVGLQLIGHRGHEAELLDLAAQAEAALARTAVA
jgi:aspartyl-tRNA(Asn)/glutamyl-tRNA(Gln) amidotransferase subunit A